MDADLINEYQRGAAKILARNKSVLDILSKLQYANARAARSVIKAVTSCGCIEIDGRRGSVENAGSQIRGSICEDCAAAVETQIGEAVFYTASLCNALGISLEDIFRKDMSRSDMMGDYTLR